MNFINNILVSSISCLVSLQLLAAAENININGNYFSASGLPLSEGLITEFKYRNGNELNKKVISLAERFDKANSMINKDHIPLKQYIREISFKPNALPWEDLGEQWCAATSDKNVTSLINNFISMNCNGVYFSRGDVKELLSLFYEKEELVSFGPKKSERKIYSENLEYKELIDDILNRTKFSAHVFEKEINKYIKKGPIILDIEYDENYWYQPVISAESKRELVTEVDLKDYEIPSKFIKAKTKKGKNILKLINEIDSILSKSYRRPSIKKIKKLMSKELKKRLKGFQYKNAVDLIYTLVELRQDNYEFLGPNVSLLSLKDNISVYKVSTKINYQVESDFRENKNYTNNKNYNYLIFKQTKLNKIVGSKWLESKQNRPGRLFVPKEKYYDLISFAKNNRGSLRKIKMISGARRKYFSTLVKAVGLSDLVNLINHCSKSSD